MRVPGTAIFMTPDPKGVPPSLLHTLKHFRPAYENRLKSLMFSPAFDLDGSLARARQMTGRDDAGAHLKEIE